MKHTRRSFLVSSAVTAAMSRSAIGANDRIRFAILGAGTRGSYVGGVFLDFPDAELAAVCDVYRPTREQVAAKLGAKGNNKPEAVNDYRRVLDRKDIDAVLIATPDHWHGPMLIEACQAGKDAYVEKPLTNTIEMGHKMRAAVRQHKRVVQVGLQQRSWQHFQENAKRVQDGLIGTVYHVECIYQGNYTRDPGPPTAPPPDLDWELFQGPAERRPYTLHRQRTWRAYYDYSGGTLLDWGVHLTDVSHWYMNVREPLTCSASGQYVRAPVLTEMLPDVLAVTWKYPKFVMTYTNCVRQSPEFDVQGNHFLGTVGWLQVNRTGYRFRPNLGGGRRGPAEPAFQPVSESFRYDGGPSDHAHVRNFLDCVKSRQDPIVDIDTGFYSVLPCILGVLSIRYGKTYAWDGTKAVPA
ncbi:MAG: Gfo/Idh/MocA family oxidoreductase [Bryobacteraceae bacterium]|nr:Gfo/Idh/MocA family oxidoreductase [Bryobacteraceae bacterium]